MIDVLLSTYYLQIEAKWKKPPEVAVIPIDGRGHRLVLVAGTLSRGRKKVDLQDHSRKEEDEGKRRSRKKIRYVSSP